MPKQATEVAEQAATNEAKEGEAQPVPAPDTVTLIWNGGGTHVYNEQAFPHGERVEVSTEVAQGVLLTRWAAYFIKE